MHRAVAFGHPEVVKLLIESGASVTERNDDGWSPLELAMSAGNSSIVDLVRSARE
ncbi:ankyrin repeat domain-containing protein [uncultured Phenylobacterium sp.]|uniref:ankyrin repeat domain-containing protein n=1 Tax=uncultured Phenylobacterium sp. TaxID=349273 RepID=UPI00345D7149